MAHVGLTGGGKMDAHLAKMAARLGTPKTVQVGFLEGSTETDGSSLPLIAFWQEFGTKTAPPRPFFRTMIAKQKGLWSGQLKKVLVAQDYDAAAALGSMGELLSGELRDSIVETNAPALSKVTLMLRKMRMKNPDLVVTGKIVGEAAARVAKGEAADGVSTKPLVDSGTMLARVAYEVGPPT